MAEPEIVLEMKSISKSFPGVKALDDVSFRLKKGTVHSLMGENGAGKSTLMKCAFGLYIPDDGEVFLEGEKVHFDNPLQGLEHGISMIHQELNPVPRRSVAENIFIGRIPTKKVLGLNFVDHKRMYKETQDLFDLLGIKIDPHSQPYELSASIIQLSDIARSVSYGAKIIIMDEPTSSLTAAETELLFKIIRDLTKQGISIIYISHKIDEILVISDEVTIMRDGKNVGNWEASELTEELIVNRMVGREMTNWFPERTNVPAEEIMEVKDFTSPSPYSFKHCTFNLRAGEILGIGGLVGSQRTELLEAVFGIRAVASGEITIRGQKVQIKESRDAIKHKIGLVTEDRRRTGIFPGLPVINNVVVAGIGKFVKFMGFLDLKGMRADGEKYVNDLNIKTPSLQTRIMNLSGGNQQKVLLARWLLTEPDILILDEPTRGIDVGAKFEIYSIMVELAKQGKAIIMISSEMPELLAMSDRILVMCEGEVSGILEGDEKTDANVMKLASKVGGLQTDAQN